MHGHPTITSTRRVGRRRRIGALLPVAGLLAGGLVFQASVPAQAAEITTFPERLYMAPEGTTLLAELVGVPVGTLPFDAGTDIISQDVRSLIVDTVDGDAGCELIDEAVGVPDYDIDDCSRVQLDVGHGRLHLGAITTEFRDYLTDPDGAGPLVAGSPNPNDPVHFLPSGATIDSEYQTVDGSLTIGINGRPDQLNNALADLVYTPDDGYWYVGSNPENLNMIVVPGNSDDPVPLEQRQSDSLTVQIRVLDVNDFPTHDGPATKTADAQIPLVISNEYTVGDVDNDEIIDDNDGGDPPPLPDGEDADMLLIGWLTCGQPIAPNTGFHFGSSIFQSNDITLQDLLDVLFPTADNPDNQLVQDAVNAGLDLIDPAIKDIVWATSDPTTFTTAFAGVSSIDEIQDALAQVTFLHNAPNDTCELVTVVSDLGNNGLPLQYVGTPFPADPLVDPFGIEVPFLGFDFNVLTITTGDLTEIDVKFVTPSIVVDEGAAPVTALAQIQITPAIHPEFQIRWDAVDGPAVGGANAGSDYAGTSNNTLIIGENVEFIPVDVLNVLGAEFPIQTNVFPDGTNEGPETFTFEIIPGAFSPPAGFTITSSADTATVTIVDDDDAPNTVALGDASVVEGDAGTTTLNIPVTLSGPADGDESVTVETAEFPAGPTSATSGVDFQPASVTVNFALGETQRLVPVTVNGDNTPEDNEQFAVNITNTNVTPTDNAAVGTITDDDGTQPDVSINNVSANEGNSGTTNFTFTVSLSAAAAGGETIEWSTSDGAAVSTGPDADFTAVSPTQLVFATGEMQKTVTVFVSGDTDVEPSEAFFVNLGNAVGLVPVDAQGQGTIVNDDSNPNASITSVTQDEGDAGTSTMTFTIGLDKPALGGETVDVNDATVTASEPGDYTFAGPQTLTFSPGDTSKTVSVTINGDTTPEADETFTMTLSNASSGLILAGGPATGTITNDDGGSIISIADASSTEGGALETVAITMTNPAGRNCFVEVSSANGTAIAGALNDYGEYNAVIVPLLQADQFDLALNVLDDEEIESDETFTLSLALGQGSDAACIIGDGVAEITIVSDDVASVVSIADTSIAEPDLGGPIAVSMTNNVGRTCVVDLTSANVSATAGADYTAIPAATTLALQGAPTGNYQLTVANDATPEGPETFTVTIALNGQSDPQCQLGDAIATVTILDDDVADNTPPTVTIEQFGGQADPTSVSPIQFRVDFSEPVTGFDDADVVLSGSAGATTAVVTPVTTSVYSVFVSGMTQSGLVIASVAADAAQDGAGNLSLASTSIDNEVQFDLPPVDTTSPTVTIDQFGGQADPTSSSPIQFRVDFSEPVTGFDDADVVLSGSAGATTAVVVPVTSSVYSVFVSGMTQSGLVVADVAADAAEDAAGNLSLASTSIDNEVQFNLLPDSTSPTVTIDQAPTQEDPTASSPIEFVVTFSEPVTGFDATDVVLSGSAGATTAVVTPVTASVYSVEVSGMTQNGLVIADVAADAAEDGAGNLSLASTSTDNEVTYDTTAPTVTINQFGGQVDPTSVSPIQFRVDFSEPVTGFSGADVLLSGSAGATTAVVTPVTTSVYSVTVSGMTQSGLVIAQVAAGAATDLAGNANPLSTSTDNEVTFDMPLTLNLPPNQTVNNDPGLAGAIVNYPMPTAAGGVEPYVFDCSPISGAFFPLGVNTVTCTVTDAEGVFVDEGFVQEAIVSGTFTITVLDNEPPTIADNPDLTRETVGNAPVTVTFPLPAASDNSGVAPTVVCTPASGSTFGIGIGTVTCTATDAAGNSASSSFTVMVTSTGSGVPGPTTPPTTAPPTTNPIFGLPATGSDPLTLLLVAIVLLSGGAVLVATTRRRRTN